MRDYIFEKENNTITKNGIEFFLSSFDGISKHVQPHIHSAIEILFINRGDFRIFANDEEYIVHEGDMILFRSNTIHRIYPLQEGESGYYVLKIRPSFLFDLADQERRASYQLSFALRNEEAKTVWLKEECDRNRISASFDRLLQESQNNIYGSDIAVKICVAEIILAILQDTESVRNHASADYLDENLGRRIYDAIMYINKHYSEDITAEDCSRYVYMSYSYFSRNFKRITGKTFKDYLNITRINRAEKALLATEKSITEIARECGFNSVSYFISIHKKIKGITPAAYRGQVKK